jgi:hypothetical protein
MEEKASFLLASKWTGSNELILFSPPEYNMFFGE